jgi:hypothetical protein
MFTDGEGTKWRAKGCWGGALFGCVVTGCIMVARMETSFVSVRV